jgi:hypothetical protein
MIEEVYKRYGSRPHYGKIFVLSGKEMHELLGEEYEHLYRMTKFFDPKEKFQNNWTKKYVTGYFEDLEAAKRQYARL